MRQPEGSCYLCINISCLSNRWDVLPYVKNIAQEKVFPIIHSPIAPIICVIPPKAIYAGLDSDYQLTPGHFYLA